MAACSRQSTGGALLPSRSTDHRFPLSNTGLSALIAQPTGSRSRSTEWWFMVALSLQIPLTYSRVKLLAVIFALGRSLLLFFRVCFWFFFFCTCGVFPECLPGGWEHMAGKTAARRRQRVSVLPRPNVPFHCLDWT